MQRLPLAALVCAALSAAHATDPDPSAEFERTLAPFRKLSEDIPAACLSACPGLSALEQGFKAAETHLRVRFDGSTVLDGSLVDWSMDVKTITTTFEKVYTDLFALMCQNKDAFTCVAQNAEVCGPPGETSGGLDLSPGGLASQMDCMCTDCPKLPAAMGSYLGWFMGMMMQGFAGNVGEPTSAPPTEEETMEMLCPMVSPLKCAAAASSCAALIQGGMNASSCAAVIQVRTGMDLQCMQKAHDSEPLSFAATSASAELALLGSLVVAAALVG